MDSSDAKVLWTKPYLLTIVATFLIYTPFALFLPVLPVYVMKELHGSTLAAGGANSLFFLAVVLFRTQTERFELMMGKTKTLAGAAFLFMVSNALLLAAGSTTAVMAIRFFSGACFAVASTRLMAMGGEIVPSARKAEGIAYVAAAVTVGMAVGPFLGLTCARVSGYPLVFGLAALMTLGGALVSLLIAIPQRTGTMPAAAETIGFRTLFEPRAIPAAIVMMLIMLAVTAVLSFVSVYADTLHLPRVSAYFFVVLALCAVGSRLLAGNAYNRYGANAVIYPATMFLAGGLFLLSTARSSVEMFAAALLIGFTYGILVPTMQTLAFAKSPPHRTGAAAATYYTFFDFGMSASAYLVGAAIPYLGYSRIYQLLGLLVLAVTLLYRQTCDRNHPERPRLVADGESP
ncbi:MFS transporter [Geomobilimonas luticola]|uniref:MFS transporter n=1 Tax=Geomobilimonas luticola TaxID=1114878 RepID=A0ABS5SD42_9BACT|nr:MFS transporter [Geomobilimonas luticola]MBT0652409.1 MFS transporter [Geomobilimonas luticola]